MDNNNDQNQTKKQSVHNTIDELVKMHAETQSKSKMELREERLKKVPSVYFVVLAARGLLIVLFLCLSVLALSGVAWMWFESAPYRAEKEAEANTITVVERAKAKALAEKEKNEIENDEALKQ